MISVWTQNYFPVGNLWSALVALTPIGAMFCLLSFFKVKGHIAALAALFITFLAAITFWGFPAKKAVLTVVCGVLAGTFPALYIILAAIFLYNIAVRSRQFDIMKGTLENLTKDRRLQVLVIAFAFEAFLDATAGFVVPIAIGTSILTGLGFSGTAAAVMALMGNVPAGAFGAITVPIVVMARVTGLPLRELGITVGRQAPIMQFIFPFWMVLVLCGFKKTKEIWLHLLVCGGSFAVTTWLVSNYFSTYLTGILSSLVCLGSLLLVIRLRPVNEVYCFENDHAAAKSKTCYSLREVLWGWRPFMILALTVMLWSLPATAHYLNQRFTILVTFPGLTGAIEQLPPAVLSRTVFPGPLAINIVGSAGTAVLIASLINLYLCRFSLKDAASLIGDTARQMKLAAVSILSFFALSYLLNYSGMAGTLGLTAARTGSLFPFFAPLLAWVSTSITGSNTATCAMLGNIQVVAARSLGLSTIMIGGIHATAAVAGKMIAPQCLAVASASAGIEGSEGFLLRKLFWHSLIFALFISVIALVQAYLMPGIIPVIA